MNSVDRVDQRVRVSRARKTKTLSSRFYSRRFVYVLKMLYRKITRSIAQSVCHKHAEEETEPVQQIVSFTAACCQVPRVACVENNRFRKSRTRQVIANPRPKEERMFTASALQRKALHAPAFTLLAVLFAVALCAGPVRADG